MPSALTSETNSTPLTKQDGRLNEEASEASNEQEIITTNLSRFANKIITLLGERRDITAGHHYRSEKDQNWEYAWCYTSREVNGVAIKIQLVNRTSPSEKPIGPIASPDTLREADKPSQLWMFVDKPLVLWPLMHLWLACPCACAKNSVTQSTM